MFKVNSATSTENKVALNTDAASRVRLAVVAAKLGNLRALRVTTTIIALSASIGISQGNVHALVVCGLCVVLLVACLVSQYQLMREHDLLALEQLKIGIEKALRIPRAQTVSQYAAATPTASLSIN